MKFSRHRFVKARLEAGLSQGDLAFRARQHNPDLKPDAAAISNYETGKHTPSANMLAAVAQATGRDIEFFYESGGEDDLEEEAALPTHLVDALRPLARLIESHDRKVKA